MLSRSWIEIKSGDEILFEVPKNLIVSFFITTVGWRSFLVEVLGEFGVVFVLEVSMRLREEDLGLGEVL